MASDKSELRQLAPNHLLQALDAIAMAKGMDRNSYVVHVLSSEVRRYLAEASVATRALQGNPLLTEAGGRASQ